MVRCECGHIFCFSCMQEGHWPATCEQVKWYNETHQRKHADPNGEEKTLKWLEKYTQDCPKCTAPIEKNGGCNHMSCKGCSYQFCWVCLGDWAGSHYNCTTPTKASSSDRDLERRLDMMSSSLSFNQLYVLHDSSRIHDDVRIKRIAEDKMQTYIRTIADASLENCEVIVEAIEHIFLCRHIILNICVAGMHATTFQLGGGKKLKTAIGKLQSNINLLCSVIDVPVKQLNFVKIASFTKAVRTGIKSFQLRLAEISEQQKKK